MNSSIVEQNGRWISTDPIPNPPDEWIEAQLNRKDRPIPLEVRRKQESSISEWLIEKAFEDLSEMALGIQENQILLILAAWQGAESDETRSTVYKVRLGITDVDILKSVDLGQDPGFKAFDSIDLIVKLVNIVPRSQRVPVLIRWEWDEQAMDILDIDQQIAYLPIEHVSSIPIPFQWAPEPVKPTPSKSKVVKPLEKDLESDLLKWLHMRGIQADNQIKTSKHRMDLWIPGKCFLELKTGKVSGDDVCQAIDYCAEYKLPVVLVGNHIGEMASRGVEAFNKAVEGDLIAFVQWSAVKTYLKGLLQC
jgi:hypothetical protein